MPAQCVRIPRRSHPTTSDCSVSRQSGGSLLWSFSPAVNENEKGARHCFLAGTPYAYELSVPGTLFAERVFSKGTPIAEKIR